MGAAHAGHSVDPGGIGELQRAQFICYPFLLFILNYREYVICLAIQQY